jgi:hypothetical protein
MTLLSIKNTDPNYCTVLLLLLSIPSSKSLPYTIWCVATVDVHTVLHQPNLLGSREYHKQLLHLEQLSSSV